MKTARTTDSNPETPVTSGFSQVAPVANVKTVTKASPSPLSDSQERLVTVQVWARGRMSDAIVKAFVSEHARERTVKRTPTAWATLFQKFSTAGRA